MNQENPPENKELKPVYMAPPGWYHPSQEEDEIDLVSLIGVLWRRKKLIAGIALGIAVMAAMLVFFVMTPRYKVSALVSPGIIGFNEEGSPIPASSLSDLQQWLNSGGYIDDMLLQLPPDARALELIPNPGTIETNVPRNGQIMSVNLFTPEPEKGKESLQIIFDIMAESQQTYEYARKNLEKNIADIDQQLDNWDIQQTRHVVAIKKAEQEVGLMKNDLELLETSHQFVVKKAEQEIGLMKNDLALLKTRHQSAIEKVEKEIELLERDMVRLNKDIQAQKKSMGRLDEQIQEINANTRKIRTQRDDIADTAKENDIALLMYSNIIQQNIDYAIRLEQRQDQMESGVLEQIQQYSVKQVEINNKGLDLTDLKEKQALELKRAENELANQEQELVELKEKQVQALLRSKKELESKELELDDLKENKVRELEETQKELARQSELLKSQIAQLSPLRIVQKPMFSDEPVKPDKQKIIALAAIMGIFLGVLMAFLVEFYVKNKDRLNEKLS